MDGTTTMQGTEQEVQNTATETQGQQTAESTPGESKYPPEVY